MPKSDYAMLWTSDIGYMPGTNGILNALEFYKFPPIDKYVLFFEDKKNLPEGYTDQFPDVNFLNLDPTFANDWPVTKSAYLFLVFADIAFALKNLRDYKAVLFWGADVCPLSNFSIWFDIAAKVNTMVLGSNEQGTPNYNAMSKEWPYGHTWDVPFGDIPFFVPTSMFYVLEKLMEFMATPGVRFDRMDGLNYATRDTNAQVLAVPGVHWIFNGPASNRLVFDPINKWVYNCRHRMSSFHRKYWIVSYLKNYVNNLNDNAKRNVKVFNTLWHFFNQSCRVKWDKGVELWDGNM